MSIVPDACGFADSATDDDMADTKLNQRTPQTPQTPESAQTPTSSARTPDAVRFGPSPSPPPAKRQLVSPPTPQRGRSLKERSLMVDEVVISSGTLVESEIPNLPAGKSLGEGSFYKAYEVSVPLGNRYAVKETIQPLYTLAKMNSLLHEVQLVHGLAGGLHPNVLQYFCAWKKSGHLCIATELCNFTMNEAFVGTAETPALIPEVKRAAFLMAALDHIASGLAHVHKSNVAHLDIKPTNIFFHAPTSCWKIGDFGQAMIWKKTMAGQHDERDEGDSRYLSPEALQGKPCFASDIFSLGMLAYHVLAGQAPPKEGKEYQLLRGGRAADVSAHLARKINANSKVAEHTPKFLVDLIVAMLRCDPKMRPTPSEIIAACAPAPQAPTPSDTTERARPALNRCQPTMSIRIVPPKSVA